MCLAGLPGLGLAETLEEFGDGHLLLAGELDLGEGQGAVGGGHGEPGLAVGEDGARRGMEVFPFFGAVDLQGDRSFASLRMTGLRFAVILSGAKDLMLLYCELFYSMNIASPKEKKRYSSRTAVS